jgi:hypothetical protein
MMIPPAIGADSARVQLRNALTTYLHQLDPPAPMGYHHWTPAGLAARPCPTLLVGDPIVLSVTRPLAPLLCPARLTRFFGRRT